MNINMKYDIYSDESHKNWQKSDLFCQFWQFCFDFSKKWRKIL